MREVTFTVTWVVANQPGLNADGTLFKFTYTRVDTAYFARQIRPEPDLPTLVSLPPKKTSAGFTLVELLIGMSLALMIMTAVLTSYVTLGRNFTRTLGVNSSNQPPVETQSRRTLAYFTQDVRMASGISGTPTISSLTLTLPAGTGTTTVAYSYDSSRRDADAHPLQWHGANIAVQHHVERTDLPLLRYFRPTLMTTAPRAYTTVTTYATGIKQVSLSFIVQAGSSTNGTLTQVYETDSPRLIIRNKALPQ